MRRQGKWILSSVAVAIALATIGAEVAAAQRAPGGPPGPSEFDAFYTLGPDSLPREGVPKGESRGIRIAMESPDGVRERSRRSPLPGSGRISSTRC